MTTRTQKTALYAPLTRRRSGVLGVLTAINSLWRQRKTLSELDAHLLNDIGVTPEMAKNEANRPFWDIPSHWIS